MPIVLHPDKEGNIVPMRTDPAGNIVIPRSNRNLTYYGVSPLNRDVNARTSTWDIFLDKPLSDPDAFRDDLYTALKNRGVSVRPMDTTVRLREGETRVENGRISGGELVIGTESVKISNVGRRGTAVHLDAWYRTAEEVDERPRCRVLD